MNDSSTILKHFDYRPRRWQCVALFVLALSGTAVLVFFAFTLDGPVNVRGFRLAPVQGRMLFGSAAVISLFGLLAVGGLVFVAFIYDRRVALTDSHVILPKPTQLGLSCDEIQIPLESISQVCVHDFIGASKLLRIDHSNGVVSIPSIMFCSISEFYAMCRAVEGAADSRST